MNKDAKELWINALRSGKYPKEYGYLRSGDCFCALGVLCDLAIRAGVNVEITTWTDSSDETIVYYDGRARDLPSSVMRWAGLDSKTAVFRAGDAGVSEPWESVSDMNDDGFTFEEIADAIEEYF